MALRAAPWWTYVVAASYLAFLGLLFECDTRRVEPFGFRARFDQAGMALLVVAQDSPAAHAGLIAGDRITAANDRPIHTRGDWHSIELNLVIGSPLHLVVRRDGRDQFLEMVLGRAPPGFWQTPSGIVLMTLRTLQLLTLLIGMLVVFKRPTDPLALLGGWLMGAASAFSISLPYGLAAVWRALPEPLGALLWVPFFSSISVGAIVFTFFAAFPRPLLRSRRFWIAAWIPALVAAGSYLYAFAWVVYQPRHAARAPDTRSLMALGAMYGAAGIAALALNYRRLNDVNERRRVRVIVPGSVIGLVAFIAIAVAQWTRGPANMMGPLFGSPLMAVGASVLLALPISFAYAILRRRLFDLSTLVRQGVRYALARRVMLALAPLLILVVAGDLIRHRTEAFPETLATRGSIYMTIVAVALFVSWRRGAWLTALDRHFFRDRYDSARLLQEVSANLRHAGILDRISPTLVGQLEAALHPCFAALLARASGEMTFVPLASAPAGAAPPPIPADWKSVALARVLDAPLVLAADGDQRLTRQLPQTERDYIRDSGLEILVPVQGTNTDVMLALGAKRSEEPYTSEDLAVLSGVANALAFVVQRSNETARASVGLEECPSCGRCYDSGTARCPDDDRRLESETIGRVLARRYRLDRLLGRGGMGKLYEAVDLALERQVAVKALREEWTRTEDSGQRFAREARISASFSHPNVVTVFDFGISDGRAFLVMELLTGGTLREEITSRGRLPIDDVISVLRGVCAALDAAHARRLIHRDLKPENIFLSRTGSLQVVKLLDFGLAKVVPAEPDQFASGPVLVGTLPYMAPEQLRGEPALPSSDLWALGVVTYEMLTGALPFALAAIRPETSIAERPSSGWPDPFESLRDEGAATRAFFGSALALDPGARPRTAAEYLHSFELVAVQTKRTQRRAMGGR